jgi:HD superfamily phosphohydrolase
MKELTHRDEIHGDVDYDPLAVALLNTPTLQRLGRVYQLGYGHLVYRGGTHTRLSHCMGTYATAARLVAALRHKYESRSYPPDGAIPANDFLPRARAGSSRAPGPELTLDIALPADSATESLADRWAVLQHLVSWAGLLHDIGHVPMGHTLEDEFEGIYEKHDAFASARLRHLWLGDSSGTESEVHEVLRRTELYPESFARVGLANSDDVWAVVFLICTWKEKV